MPKKKQESSDVVGKVRLKNVRLSFPALFEPKSFKGSEPRYSATLLLDKEKDKAQILRIRKAITAVAKEEWGDNVPKRLTTPLRDGDEKEDLDGYGEDVMFIAAHSYSKIPIIDVAKNTLTAKDGKPYSGCYVHVVIQLWAQDDKDYGKAVRCALRAVMFAKDGEPFGGGQVDAEEEFADLIEEAEEAGLDEEDDLLG